MKKITTQLTLVLSLLSVNVLAAENYTLEPSLSTINFATIKNQYVVEPAMIDTLSGKVHDNGSFNLSVDLKGLSTGISIRDSRVNELFFNSLKFPEIKIDGQFNLDKIKNGPIKTSVPANVTFYGTTKLINFPVIIVPTENYLAINSYTPIIIDSADFGIPENNLTALAETVGGIKISNRVPLNINLTFKKQ